jgi:glycerol-3-phosphate cytidylyltransferase-like family protein
MTIIIYFTIIRWVDDVVRKQPWSFVLTNNIMIAMELPDYI